MMFDLSLRETIMALPIQTATPSLPERSGSLRPDSPLSGGSIWTDVLENLYKDMNNLGHNAADLLAKLNRKREIGAEAKDKANMVDSAIASLKKDTDKGAVAKEVLGYLRENRVTLADKTGSKTVDEWLSGKNIASLDKGELNTLKAALDSLSSRASDFSAQSNLDLQKLSNTNQLLLSMATNTLAMQKNALDSIIRNIH